MSETRSHGFADTPALPPAPMQRAQGAVSLRFGHADGKTRLQRQFQSGQMKVRLPRTHGTEPPVAVLLNTAGGITGGDRFAIDVTLQPGARAVITSQAAERIYRRTEGVGLVETHLTLAEGAFGDWLPQETILFDRCGLDRRLDIDVATDARLIALETLVLGRTASGEQLREVDVVDRWRVRIGGRLAFADALRLNGDIERMLAGPATARGAVAIATLVMVGHGEASLDQVRALLADVSGEAGASHWNGVTVARFVAWDARALRRDLVRVLEHLRGVPMPRVWSC